MIEQPLPDRKRDYWGTIFNTVVPDDNAGKVTGRSVAASTRRIIF